MASLHEISEHIGCQWLQGYFFPPPLTAGELATFIRNIYVQQTPGSPA